ncbi:hypothetical protein IKQ21_01550 [bacterium]|nr:hypothetical protein [bacterium]
MSEPTLFQKLFLKDIKADGNCKVTYTRAGEDSKPSKLLFNDGKLADIENVDITLLADKNISIFEKIGMLDGDSDSVSLKDLSLLRKYFGIEKYKFLFEKLGITSVRFDANAGIENIEINGAKLSIDFETEVENPVPEKEITPPAKDTNIPKKENLGGYNELKKAVGMRESSNNYKKVNDLGYLGMYQFGKLALIDLDYRNQSDGSYTGKNGVYSKEDFLNNPQAQEDAFKRWLPRLWGYLKKIEMKDKNGKKYYVDATKFLNEDGYVVIKGQRITASGLILGAHLKGPKAVYNYLATNGKDNAKDGFGTSVEEYLTKFSGYELDFTEKV